MIRLITLTRILIGASLIAGCAAPPSPWTPPPASAEPHVVLMRRLDEGLSPIYRMSSGLDDAATVAIRTEADWHAQWRRIMARSGPPRAAPMVNFARDMVLVAAMGRQATGGYTVTIDRVVEFSDRLEVHVVHTQPGARCGVTAALSSPMDIAIVPTSSKTVDWRIDTRSHDC